MKKVKAVLKYIFVCAFFLFNSVNLVAMEVDVELDQDSRVSGYVRSCANESYGRMCKLIKESSLDTQQKDKALTLLKNNKFTVIDNIIGTINNICDDQVLGDLENLNLLDPKNEDTHALSYRINLANRIEKRIKNNMKNYLEQNEKVAGPAGDLIDLFNLEISGIALKEFNIFLTDTRTFMQKVMSGIGYGMGYLKNLFAVLSALGFFVGAFEWLFRGAGKFGVIMSVCSFAVLYLTFLRDCIKESKK